MRKYIVGRLLMLIPMLLGASFIIFFMLRLGRGDPALDYLRLSQIPPTDEAIAEARNMLGLNRPIMVQYGSWLWNALHLDFGKSYVTHKPVMEDFLYYLPASLQLGSVAFLFIMLVSIPLGMWAAANRDRWPDQLVRYFSFVGVSLPNFWLGFLLVLFFSIWLDWLPPFGRDEPGSIIMPVITLSLMSLSVNARLLRSSMLEVKGQRYVLWAAMRGLPGSQVTVRHVLRNAMLPLLTAAGMHLAELIGWSMVVEIIFAWPGVGRWSINAIYNRDFPVLQCFTRVMTTMFVLMNLGIDILCAWLDPRIRYSGDSQGGH